MQSCSLVCVCTCVYACLRYVSLSRHFIFHFKPVEFSDSFKFWSHFTCQWLSFLYTCMNVFFLLVVLPYWPYTCICSMPNATTTIPSTDRQTSTTNTRNIQHFRVVGIHGIWCAQFNVLSANINIWLDKFDVWTANICKPKRKTKQNKSRKIYGVSADGNTREKKAHSQHRQQ